MILIKKTFGFSLSEVLLTLGIIGVVAAMVIPNLSESNRIIEAEASAGTAYSVLSNALYTSIKENRISSIRGLCDSGNHVCFKNFLGSGLKFVHDCGTNLNSNCWTTYKYYDNSTASVEGAGVMLQNGMTLLIEWISPNCQGANNDRCARISVDVNGPKGPNCWGKDTFAFHVWENSLVPYGMGSDTGNMQTCNPNDTGAYSGFGCAAKYVTRRR